MNRQAVNLLDEIQTLLRAAEFNQLMAICKGELANARQREDAMAETAALMGWAQAHKYLGKFNDARILIDGALRLAREIDHPELEAMALTISGSMHLIGRFQPYEAEEDYRQALKVAHMIGDRAGTAAALAGVGASLNMKGDFARAPRFAREAFDIAREEQQTETMAASLAIMGSISVQTNKDDQALQAYQDALDIVQSNGIRLQEGELVTNIGVLLSRNDRYQREGVQMIERALEMAQQIKCAPHEYNALRALGDAYQSLHQADQARAYYQQMLDRAQAWGARTYEGGAFFNLGIVAVMTNDTQAAFANFEQARAITREAMNPYQEATVEVVLATLHSQQKQLDAAIEHYRAARNIYQALDDDRNARQMLQNIIVLYARRLLAGFLRMIGVRPRDPEDE
jgi:tetratricopeptide (TPR) repeat protein